MSSDAVRRNRSSWNRDSDAYQRTHGEVLTRTAMAWGVWRIPERELGVLGDLRGRDVLELGCGAAAWSVALAEQGARVVAMDLSERQLRYARAAAEGAGPRRPSLLQADAEQLPFRDARFDVVFCDHGATSFSRPEATLPQVARVLRPGGLLAFCIASPLRDCCQDPATDAVAPALARDYFGLGPSRDRDGTTCYQLPYGAWIRLFRSCGLVVEDLIEPRPAADATTGYLEFVSLDWARRWPAEALWKLRRKGA